MMVLLLSLAVPSAAIAFMGFLYWFYPSFIIKGVNRYGHYWYAGLHRRFVEAGGITFCYLEREAKYSAQTAGAPPTTIVFSHGLAGSKNMWVLMARYLPQEWRLVMMDLPGHGDSTFVQGATYSINGLTEMLHNFLNALELENVHLVGISFGSTVSALYAALHPQAVESLTIMCMPGIHKLPGGVMTNFFEDLRKGCHLVMPENVKEFHRMMKLVLYDPQWWDMFHDRVVESAVEIQKQNYENIECIVEDLVNAGEDDPQYISSMAECLVSPTLVLWGDSDQICHPSGASIAGNMIRNSRVVILEKCGHAIIIDRPRKCSEVLCHFINEVTSSSVDPDVDHSL